MATASGPVNSAAQETSADPGATTAADNAPSVPKNPFADTKTTDPSEPAASAVSKPLAVTPEVHKPADTPAATANGDTVASSITPAAPAASASNGTGLNGSGTKLESLVPEETKETNAPVPVPVPAPAPTTEQPAAGSSSSISAQPPVMTGALPPGDQSNSTAPVSKPAESTEKDGVEDITGASAVPKPNGPTQTDDIKDASVGSTAASDVPAPAAEATPSASKPSTLNGAEKDGGLDAITGTVLDEKKDGEKKDAAPSSALPSADNSSTAAPAADLVDEKDVEMKDAAPVPASEKPSAPVSTPAPVTAPATDASGVASTTGAPTTTPALATPSDVAATATGGKRKAETDAEEPAGEPAAKKQKQKGAFSRAMDKAKEAVKDVKEKAKPGRKPGKREKKEVAPVGRTERKTRSQARAE